jgi:hypothetical protein
LPKLETKVMWKDSLDTVDAAHESGMLHGIQLHTEWDYRVLSTMFCMESLYGEMDAESSGEHELELGGPTWWFYENTSVSEYKEIREANWKGDEEKGT